MSITAKSLLSMSEFKRNFHWEGNNFAGIASIIGFVFTNGYSFEISIDYEEGTFVGHVLARNDKLQLELRFYVFSI